MPWPDALTFRAAAESRGSFRAPSLDPGPHVSLTNSIRSLQHRALRLLPSLPQAYERPEFAVPALAAFALALLLLLALRWPPTICFAPTLVLACRYYELARFRTVRCSRLAFLLTLVCAAACALWAFTHRSGFEQPLTLGLALTSVALAVHLFTHQRREARLLAAQSVFVATDEDAPYWACGGLLAVMPVLLLIGCMTGLASWRSPLTLLWGLSGIVVLVAQLRSHRWFPRLATAWLMTWLGIETLGTFAAGGDARDDAIATYFVVGSALGSIATYLIWSPRVRRTFGGERNAPTENPAPTTPTPRAPVRPAPRGAVPPSRTPSPAAPRVAHPIPR